MPKIEASIRKTLHSIHPVHFRITKKKLDRSSLSRKLFLETIENLQKIEIRREYLAHNIGLDVTGFEDLYFKVIENLLNISFNKNQLSLLHRYLYELSPDDDWDGFIELTIRGEKQKVNIKTPKLVWDILQKIK
tara:strand:+ start:1521 stop:1922 length:402 start_codon:yes stop_codon:yes gene_type:complete